MACPKEPVGGLQASPRPPTPDTSRRGCVQPGSPSWVQRPRGAEREWPRRVQGVLGGLPRPPVSCALGPRGPFSMKAGDRKRGGRGHHKRDQNSALRSPEQLKPTDRSRRVGGETEAGEEEAAGRARRPRTPRPRTPPALDLPGRTQPAPAQGPSPGRLPRPGALCRPSGHRAPGPAGRLLYLQRLPRLEAKLEGPGTHP